MLSWLGCGGTAVPVTQTKGEVKQGKIQRQACALKREEKVGLAEMSALRRDLQKSDDGDWAANAKNVSRPP